jgi:hypothetical protein
MRDKGSESGGCVPVEPDKPLGLSGGAASEVPDGG